MTQIRQTDTKTYIKQALTQLLAETDFERLTVSHITKKAGINRGTFYLHYTDKYDLIQQLKEDTLSHIEDSLEAYRANPKAGILSMLTYLQSDFAFISTISKVSFINFSESIKDFTFRVLSQDNQLEASLTQSYQIPYTYALEVYLSSIESLIRLWIERGALESPEEMADIIFTVAWSGLNSD